MLTVSGPLATGCSAADDPLVGALQGHIQNKGHQLSTQLEVISRRLKIKTIFTVLIPPVSTPLREVSTPCGCSNLPLLNPTTVNPKGDRWGTERLHVKAAVSRANYKLHVRHD